MKTLTVTPNGTPLNTTELGASRPKKNSIEVRRPMLPGFTSPRNTEPAGDRPKRMLPKILIVLAVIAGLVVFFKTV
ncbi:MAG: hypothetical protein ACI9NC_006297, partial [Verrucomicrobiales bacterium]